jgi:hypothetical protein
MTLTPMAVSALAHGEVQWEAAAGLDLGAVLGAHCRHPALLKMQVGPCITVRMQL